MLMMGWCQGHGGDVVDLNLLEVVREVVHMGVCLYVCMCVY